MKLAKPSSLANKLEAAAVKDVQKRLRQLATQHRKEQLTARLEHPSAPSPEPRLDIYA